MARWPTKSLTSIPVSGSSWSGRCSASVENAGGVLPHYFLSDWAVAACQFAGDLPQ